MLLELMKIIFYVYWYCQLAHGKREGYAYATID